MAGPSGGGMVIEDGGQLARPRSRDGPAGPVSAHAETESDAAPAGVDREPPQSPGHLRRNRSSREDVSDGDADGGLGIIAQGEGLQRSRLWIAPLQCVDEHLPEPRIGCGQLCRRARPRRRPTRGLRHSEGACGEAALITRPVNRGPVMEPLLRPDQGPSAPRAPCGLHRTRRLPSDPAAAARVERALPGKNRGLTSRPESRSSGELDRHTSGHTRPGR